MTLAALERQPRATVAVQGIGRDPRLIYAWTGIASGAVTLALGMLSPEPVDGQVQAAAWLALSLCAYPGVRWLLGPRDTVPIVEAIFFSYGLQFVAPSLLLSNAFGTSVYGRVWFAPVELAAALVSVSLGMASMFAGYQLALKVAAVRRFPSISLPLHPNRLTLYLVLAVFGGASLSVARVGGAAPTPDSGLFMLYGILANQLLLASAILAYRVLGEPSTPRLYSWLLAAAIILSVTLGFMTSMLEIIMLVPVIVGLVGLQVKSRVSLAIIAILIGTYVLVQPMKHEYRHIIGNYVNNPTLMDRITIWFEVGATALDMAAGGVRDIDGWFEPDSAREQFARLDLMHAYTYVRAVTPDYVPLYGGATYSYLLYGWIPRLVWQDKPTVHDENIRMVLDYGLLFESQIGMTMTSVGTLAEGFANFGEGGVIGAMLVQGIVLGGCTWVFNVRGSIASQAVLLATVVYFLNGIGSSTSFLYGGLAQQLGANALIIWLFMREWR